MSGPADQIFGNYQVDELLGSGGMGRVYRGHHQHLGWPAAIKVMHQHLTMDPSFRARFLREALTTARLEHPHIVRLIDYGEQGDALYLVMELVSDGSLRSLLRKREEPGTIWSPTMGIDIVRQTALGLEYAHAQGAVHRDIKPDNLMLVAARDAYDRPTYIVKITDFGLAQVAEGSVLTASGTMVGTPAYMSPEQCQNQPIDSRSDLYSLGIVLYEVVTGRLPFQTRTISDAVYHHIFVPAPPPRTILPDIAPELEAIIMRCLEKRPDDRYARAGDLANDLATLIGSDALPIPTLQMTPLPVSVAGSPPTPPPSGATPAARTEDPNEVSTRVVPVAEQVESVPATARSRRKPLLLAGIAALILLIMASAAALALRSSGGDDNTVGAADATQTHESIASATPAPISADAQNVVNVVSQPSVASLLGEPYDIPRQTLILFQVFERGVMMSLENIPGDETILVAGTIGHYGRYYQRLSMDEVDNLPEITETPTPTIYGYVPEAPFDRVIQSDEEVGVALGPPVNESGGRGVYQQFDHGLAVWLFQTDRVWIFYGDSANDSVGEWEEFWLPLEPQQPDIGLGTELIALAVESTGTASDLGEPIGDPVGVPLRAQEFERGLLIDMTTLRDAMSELDGTVLALWQPGGQSNGAVESYVLDDYGWEIPPEETPPTDQYPALYPFSRIWNNNETLRERLRWALWHHTFTSGVVQQYERGAALWIPETSRVWIIVGDLTSSDQGFWIASWTE